MELVNRESLPDEKGLDQTLVSPKTDTSSSSQSSSSPPTAQSMSSNPRLQNYSIEFPPLGDLQCEVEGEYVWNVPNYSKMPTKQYSEKFKVGNYWWRILCYPRGNEPYEESALSLYLAIEPPENAIEGGLDWSCCTQMILSVGSSPDSTNRIFKSSQHRFEANESDWGFGSFCSLKSLTTCDNTISSQPILSSESDPLCIIVRIRIIKDVTGILWHNFVNYNSKKVTGFVGLANQGATCYMNSLLQSLYFTNAFRRAIYLIPTDGDIPTDNNALALQRIFWRLQHDEHPVSTNELTRAFGWETLESFIQSDVQEFSRVLLDELESKMKGTAAEGTIEKLFVGKVRNVIKCLNVPFESTRTENFYDLQLSIKGLSTLEESFEAYVKAEMLEGDNKYHAEGYGLQDAKRYVEFEALPPVLHLHLERYAFDPRVMATVKINDRLEFPLEIDLSKYLSHDSPQRGQEQNYILQCVFVHSGDSHGGHYYVYIRHPLSEGEPKWYKFDDTKVIPAMEKEAVDDNFGGIDSSSSGELDANSPVMTRSMSRMLNTREKMRKFTNAYMLIYIRKSDLNTVLCQLDNERDIPRHIGKSIEAEDEAERKKRQEKQQSLMSIKVHVLTDEQLGEHGAFDFYNFENRNWPLTEPLSYRILRTETIKEFKDKLAEQIYGGCLAEDIRLWTFAPRRNKTIRLDEPISANDKEKPISQLLSRSSTHQPNLVIYAERISKKPPPTDICIAFKFYNPQQGKLRIVGKLYLSPQSKVETCLPNLREFIGVSGSVELELYEEVKPGRIELINTNRTFAENQLGTGDIICFQLAAPLLTGYH